MSAPNTYDVGDLVTVSGTFRNLAGNLETPATYECKVKDPSGNIATSALTVSSTGVLTATVDADEEGTWYYRIAGLTGLQAAAEGTFIVRASQFS